MADTDKLLEWAGEAGVDFKPSPRDLYASMWLGELEHIVDLAAREKNQEIAALERSNKELLSQCCRARNLIECGETAAALNCLCDAIAALSADKGEK